MARTILMRLTAYCRAITSFHTVVWGMCNVLHIQKPCDKLFNKDSSLSVSWVVFCVVFVLGNEGGCMGSVNDKI